MNYENFLLKTAYEHFFTKIEMNGISLTEEMFEGLCDESIKEKSVLNEVQLCLDSISNYAIVEDIENVNQVAKELIHAIRVRIIELMADRNPEPEVVKLLSSRNIIFKDIPELSTFFGSGRSSRTEDAMIWHAFSLINSTLRNFPANPYSSSYAIQSFFGRQKKDGFELSAKIDDIAQLIGCKIDAPTILAAVTENDSWVTGIDRDILKLASVNSDVFAWIVDRSIIQRPEGQDPLVLRIAGNSETANIDRTSLATIIDLLVESISICNDDTTRLSFEHKLGFIICRDKYEHYPEIKIPKDILLNSKSELSQFLGAFSGPKTLDDVHALKEFVVKNNLQESSTLLIKTSQRDTMTKNKYLAYMTETPRNKELMYKNYVLRSEMGV